MSCLKEDQPHEFIDVYNEKESIPDGVINLAAQCDGVTGISAALGQGKVKSKEYVLSYCKKCGYKVEKAEIKK